MQPAVNAASPLAPSFANETTDLVSGMSFEDLSRLAKEDPVAFIDLRRRVIQDTIRQAPDEQQARMQQIQDQIDHFNALNPSPQVRLAVLARMQTEALERLGKALSELDSSLKVYRQLGVTLQNSVAG